MGLQVPDDEADLSAVQYGEKGQTMKTWYLATFKWSDSGVYCTNLVLTDSEEKAEKHYSKYEMVSIRIADEWEINSYRSRGCPVVEL